MLINIYYLFTSVNKTIPIIIILILIAIPSFIIIKDPISIAYPFNFLYTFQYNKPFILNVKSIYKNDHLIKENFTQIQSEIRNILKIKSIPTVDNIYGTSNKQIKDKNDGWRIYMIKSGNNIKNNADRIPTLSHIVENDPDVISCLVSILQPHSKIPPHIGYYRGVYRYQIGIIIPKDRENCFITVDDNNYHWIEGESIIFDDNYTHSVKNDTDEIRVIVYLDIRKKFKNKILDKINSSALNLILNSTYAKNEAKKTEVIEST